MANSSFEILTIGDFVKKIKQPNFKELVSQEFTQLKNVPLKGTFKKFSKDKNANKNRYFNIPCWDHSRVILTSHGTQVHYNHSLKNSWNIVVTDRDSESTYIHANFVDGFEDKKKYICCQGPKKTTATDMWKLVWENDVRIIVSLTNIDNEDKVCYAYWVAEEGYEIVFGRYVVETVEIEEKPSFLKSQLRVIDFTSGKSRLITHYWYTDWPDYGIPAELDDFYTLLSIVNQERQQLIEIATSKNLPKPGPIVVHCSAGVGRTGTFCAVDHALGQLKKEKTVSIQNSVIAVREMRHSSVIMPDQYMFIYKVIEHVLLGEENKKNLK